MVIAHIAIALQFTLGVPESGRVDLAPDLGAATEEIHEASGSTKDVLLDDAIRAFNRRSAMRRHGVEPALTGLELRAALQEHLMGGEPSPELRKTYEDILKTGLLPRGSRLSFVGGRKRAQYRTDNAGWGPVNIDFFAIYLDVWLDRFPDEPDGPTFPRLLIRLRYRGSTPS